jgi:hypothetical protein
LLDLGEARLVFAGDLGRRGDLRGGSLRLGGARGRGLGVRRLFLLFLGERGRAVRKVKTTTILPPGMISFWPAVSRPSGRLLAAWIASTDTPYWRDRLDSVSPLCTVMRGPSASVPRQTAGAGAGAG